MKCYKNITPVQAASAEEEVRREEALDIAVGLDNMFADDKASFED